MAEFDRVVIVGVGLLGGSIGLALRAHHLAREVVGYGRRREALEEALERRAVDKIETDLTTACVGAELAVICTPVQLVVDQVQACQRLMPAGSMITDVGSTKLRISEALATSAKNVFCGSHPLAGSDKSGVAFSTANLFEDKLTIITPTDFTPEPLTERTERFWQALGSRTMRMRPEDHDCGIARTSHLPHIVAAALAAATPNSLLPLVASGWCDTTRVAGGGPELWRQILEENREPVLNALTTYADSLNQWIQALREGNGKQIEKLLEIGKRQRDAVGH